MNRRCPSAPGSARRPLSRRAARRRRTPEPPGRTRRRALLLQALGAAAPRLRRSAARLLLHGRRCVGNGVCGGSVLAVSAAAHRHKSTRIPKRANSTSNRASCPFNLTSNSESRGQGRGGEQARSRPAAVGRPQSNNTTAGEASGAVEPQARAADRPPTPQRGIAREGSTRTPPPAGARSDASKSSVAVPSE